MKLTSEVNKSQEGNKTYASFFFLGILEGLKHYGTRLAVKGRTRLHVELLRVQEGLEEDVVFDREDILAM